MNTLNFSMLEIVTQNETDALRDDGFVPDLRKHALKLFNEFDVSKEMYDDLDQLFNNGKTYVGATYCFEKGNQNIWVIFYEHLDLKNNILRRAHEETHVLHNIGKIHLLQNLLNYKGIDIDLMKLKDSYNCSYKEHEFVANIGALYVLNREGIDINVKLKHGKKSELYPALQEYKSALKKM